MELLFPSFSSTQFINRNFALLTTAIDKVFASQDDVTRKRLIFNTTFQRKWQFTSKKYCRLSLSNWKRFYRAIFNKARSYESFYVSTKQEKCCIEIVALLWQLTKQEKFPVFDPTSTDPQMCYKLKKFCIKCGGKFR